MAEQGVQGSWRPLALLVAGAFFMENLDGNIVVTATQRMARSFHVRPVQLNLPVAAYLLVLGAFIPVSGWLAERTGARKVFTGAVFLFSVSSGLCAISTSLDFLTVMRGVQGVGGAMMVPVGRLVVLRAVDRLDLIHAVAYLTWPALAAPVVAPAVGGALTTFLSWRWVFVVNIPLGCIALPFSVRLVPDVRAARVRRLDWVGFLLTSVGLVFVVGGLESVTDGEPAPWSLGLLMSGALIVVASVIHLNHSSNPLLDLRVLRARTYRVMAAGGSLSRMANAAMPFLLPLMFQEVWGWAPLKAGLMIVPIFVANISVKPFTTRLMRVLGFRTVLMVSNIAYAVAVSSCALLALNVPLALIVVMLLPVGMFRSIGFSAYNTIYLADIAPDEMNNANTLASMVQQLTLGVGVAVGGIVLFAATYVNRCFGVSSSTRSSFAAAFVMLAVLPVFAAWEASGLRRQDGTKLTERRAEPLIPTARPACET